MPTPLERNARIVAVLTLVSRVTGLIREAVLSRLFGAGGLMDAFFFAFMLPNLFRRLFGEGALAAAFLPEYTALDRDDPETARRLATLVVAGLSAGLGALVVLGEIVLWLIAARAGHQDLVVRLMMLTLPYMPLVCIVAILGAMLHVHGRFGPPAAAPILLNLAMIGTALAVTVALGGDGREVAIGATAASIVVAGVLQVAWSLWALRDVRWLARGGRSDSATRTAAGRVARQAGPMILGLGVLQLNTFLDGLIASYPVTVGPTIFGIAYPLEEGAMAAVSFAQRLYQFPLGVFGIAIATAIYPQLARLADDRGAFTETLRRGLRLVVFIGLPASAGLILVREPLTAVILEGGRFSTADTERVARVLLWYAPAIWSYSMVHVLTRACYARRDSAAPVRIALAIVGLNLLLNATLIWTPLREAGLAMSTAICSVIQTVALTIATRRHAPGAIDRPVASSWLRSAVLTALMTAAVAAVALILPPAETWRADLLTLAALVATGVATAVAAALFLRMPEMGWVGRKKG